MSAILFDYGKLFVSDGDYRLADPRTLDDAVAMVRAAVAEGRSLRLRGSGHSLSGTTLPRRGECLLRTAQLDQFRIEAPDTITVGAGAVLWDIRDFVAGMGWRLPVYNGGWAGPSLGGYISAGGMGLRVPPSDRGHAGSDGGPAHRVSISEMHGGFWEQVRSITLVDGRGRVHRIVEADARFPWLFASGGQFGLFVEAELKLLPRDPASPALPVGRCGRIPHSNPMNAAETDGGAPAEGMPWLYWFSLLVAEDLEAEAWDHLGRWADRHRGVIAPTGGWVGPCAGGAPIGFRYVVRRRRFTPPLLYPRHEDFVLMGVMAVCDGIGCSGPEAALVEAERAFVAMSCANGWSLYAQAENLTRSLDFAEYYGADRYGRFRALKQAFDPDGRINPGEVFAGGTAAPRRAGAVRGRAGALARVLALKEA